MIPATSYYFSDISQAAGEYYPDKSRITRSGSHFEFTRSDWLESFL